MPRERKGIIRKSGGQSKDPYVIFVIASEGTNTEPAYFDLIGNYLKTCSLGRLVKIESLKRAELASGKDTDSYYLRVIGLLDEYKEKYLIKEGDELWCLIDRDKWTQRSLADANKLCGQKGYQFCLTSPCFEFWLLLHFKHLNDFSATDQNVLLENRKIRHKETSCSLELSKVLKMEIGEGFRKNRIHPVFLQNLPLAVRRAFELKLEENHWRLDKFCTRIHLLIGNILQMEPPQYDLKQ